MSKQKIKSRLGLYPLGTLKKYPIPGMYDSIIEKKVNEMEIRYIVLGRNNSVTGVIT